MMQQWASLRYWPAIAILGILFLTPPARSQQGGNAASGGDAKSYTDFGISDAEKGDLAGAISAFNQALQIDPGYVPAYYVRGLAHEKQNDLTDAVADYDHAIQLAPAYLPAYYQRGSIKGRAGDFDGAISDFTQVIKIDPKYAPAYYNLGHVHYFKGDLDGAIEQITEGLRLQPDNALGYFIRGLARRAKGEKNDALSDFQKSAGLSFSYATFWVWISQVEIRQRGLAQQSLADTLAKPGVFSPNDWPSQIANFLLEKMTDDQLIEAANQGDPAELKGRLCEAWFYIGMVKHLAGDDKGARDSYGRAMEGGVTSSEEYAEAARQLAN